MQITVKSTKIKRGTNDKGEWVNTQIDTEEGSKWTTFHASAASLQAGDVIEVEEYEEGEGNKRNKITKFKKLESKASPPPLNGNTQYKADPDKIASYENTTRAEIIADLWKAEKFTITDPEVVGLCKWLRKLENIRVPDLDSKPKDESGWDELKRDEPGKELIPQTAQELAQWAASHGKTYTPTWICKELNVKSLTDITDFKNAIATLKENAGWE
jgi:hypothetical protein